ncbi:DMT family transporter [Gordonia sp. ABSL49_1]|uniref:DMT family transporter n=1 Tax=Gordonia sp. ABSL49_1 TaxID=2920941 RepID=UPI001F0DB8C6|nr:DMT family transporter [Gordonia sp. ABSL49_1]MCH5643810.1 DMT family transporter [Gordonia sp. ABSL49_1]
MILPIILALTAALLFAVASVWQAQGTRGLPTEGATGAGFLVTLARRKTWLMGIAADILGFVVQAWALAVGSLMLVQPLLVSTLLFALPLAAVTEKRRLVAREWFWAALLFASLVVFIVLGQPTEGIDEPSFAHWIIPLAIIIPLVAVGVGVGSRLPHGVSRSLTLAIAAGVLLGVSAPLTKTAISGFDDGLMHGLLGWEFWAMAVAATLGTLWQQSSYQAGSVQTSLPTVTVLKPVVAMALGLTIYQEGLRVDTAGDIAVVTALAVMAAATVMLGRLSGPADEQPADADTRRYSDV